MAALTGADQLVDLAIVFAKAGLVAVGGVITVLPEIKRQVVDVHHWMDGPSFAGLFALAQASPGPNMLVVTLVGWRVAGLAGATVASISLIMPPATLAYLMASLWRRFRGALWLRDIQAGLTSVTVGLIAAAALLLAEGSASTLGAATMVVVSSAVLVWTKLNPLWLLGAGAALGALGVI